MGSANNWAVCYSVKDEAPLLQAVLPYLEAQGCSRVYVYWDGTTDEGPEVVKGHEFVLARDSITPSELLDHPRWVQQLIHRWETSHNVRKRFNALDAARRALAEGIEWLIFIDADEIVVPSLDTTPNAQQFSEFLAAIPSNVDQIFLRNVEAVSTEDAGPRPFETSIFFTRRLPATEFMLRSGRTILRWLGVGPKLRAYFEQSVYTARFLGASLRVLTDPRTGRRIPAGHYLGYMGRKTIIRSSAGVRSMCNIHQWQPTDSPLRTITRGWVLHYDLCSLEYFKVKFRQRTASVLVPAFYTRYEIGEIARDPNDSFAETLFKEGICVDPTMVEDLIQRGLIQRFSGVRDVFEQLQKSGSRTIGGSKA